MNIQEEITDWEYTNNRYAIRGNRIVAYRPLNGEVRVFTRPLVFDRQGRRFRKVHDPELMIKSISNWRD